MGFVVHTFGSRSHVWVLASDLCDTWLIRFLLNVNHMLLSGWGGRQSLTSIPSKLPRERKGWALRLYTPLCADRWVGPSACCLRRGTLLLPGSPGQVTSFPPSCSTAIPFCAVVVGGQRWAREQSIASVPDGLLPEIFARPLRLHRRSPKHFIRRLLM